MSKMGVPSTRSAPATRSTGPSASSRSRPSSRTQLRPRALGRKGERVAKTPRRVLPPRRGGRTVGDQSSRTALGKLPDQPDVGKALQAAQGLLAPVFLFKNHAALERLHEARLAGHAEFLAQLALKAGDGRIASSSIAQTAPAADAAPQQMKLTSMCRKMPAQMLLERS